MPEQIRVMIVDDHEVVRMGLKAAIEVGVIGECAPTPISSTPQPTASAATPAPPGVAFPPTGTGPDADASLARQVAVATFVSAGALALVGVCRRFQRRPP